MILVSEVLHVCLKDLTEIPKMKWRIRTPRQIHQPPHDSSFKITVEGIGYKELSWSKGGGRALLSSDVKKTQKMLENV